jgi:hypothetical protein
LVVKVIFLYPLGHGLAAEWSNAKYIPRTGEWVIIDDHTEKIGSIIWESAEIVHVRLITRRGR